MFFVLIVKFVISIPPQSKTGVRSGFGHLVLLPETGKYLIPYTDFTNYNLYTQTKVKQHHIFFGDTVLEVAERNTWVMEIKYFEF